MSKVGRNDPCPCGSGKKHKSCCLGRPPSSELREGFKASRERAEAIAQRWLGKESSSDTPLRDSKGARLHLVMDRFSLSEPSAVAKVRDLGKVEGEMVLFYDQDRWIGEADFSVGGEMTLVSVGEPTADRLRALVKPIAGLTFQERKVDRLEALNETPAPATGLLDFKSRFFAAWPDEPNQKLDQKTPREAAASDTLRPRLRQLIQELEKKESALPKGERFSFDAIRADLGL